MPLIMAGKESIMKWNEKPVIKPKILKALSEEPMVNYRKEEETDNIKMCNESKKTQSQPQFQPKAQEKKETFLEKAGKTIKKVAAFVVSAVAVFSTFLNALSRFKRKKKAFA
jgi:hypothetical protein